MQRLESAYGRLLEVFAVAACVLIFGLTLMICADVLLRNVRVAEKGMALSRDLAVEIAAVESMLGDDGRVLVRASGTEPVVRVMVEAPTPEEAERAAERLVTAVEALGAESGHR